jgi:hypothetical protein
VVTCRDMVKVGWVTYDRTTCPRCHLILDRVLRDKVLYRPFGGPMV